MDEKLLELARDEGFYAAVIPAADVPVDTKFRLWQLSHNRTSA